MYRCRQRPVGSAWHPAMGSHQRAGIEHHTTKPTHPLGAVGGSPPFVHRRQRRRWTKGRSRAWAGPSKLPSTASERSGGTVTTASASFARTGSSSWCRRPCPPTEGPARPHALRIRPQNLDRAGRSLQARSDAPHPRTEQLDAVRTAGDRAHERVAGPPVEARGLKREGAEIEEPAAVVARLGLDKAQQLGTDAVAEMLLAHPELPELAAIRPLRATAPPTSPSVVERAVATSGRILGRKGPIDPRRHARTSCGAARSSIGRWTSAANRPRAIAIHQTMS